MSYPPYGPRGGPPMGYGPRGGGPPHAGYYPPGHGGYMHPEYDGGLPPHMMRGPPGPMADPYAAPPYGPGGGRYPPTKPAGASVQAHSSPSRPGPGSARGQTTSASDTEGGSVSGFDSESGASSKPPPRKPGEKSQFANDCEVVILNKQQQRYGELVEKKLREMGMKVDLMFPRQDIKIVEFLKPIAKTGTIFAVVIDAECERGKNIHFYQFRGVPKAQYHKNVPLAQATGLISRNYKDLQRKEVGEVPEEVNGLLTKLQTTQHLDDSEYSALIRFLQERRKRSTSFLCRTTNVVQEYKNDVNSIVESPEGKELQKRILTLLNENMAD